MGSVKSLYGNMYQLVSGEMPLSANDYIYEQIATDRLQELDSFLSHPATKQTIQQASVQGAVLLPSNLVVLEMQAEMDMLTAWLKWCGAVCAEMSAVVVRECAVVFYMAHAQFVKKMDSRLRRNPTSSTEWLEYLTQLVG